LSILAYWINGTVCIAFELVAVDSNQFVDLILIIKVSFYNIK